MPIYEYRCETCDERFEELVRGPDAAVTCPGCGGAKAERLLSAFAGVGRGTGRVMPEHPRLAQPGGGGCCGGGACGHGH